MSMTFVKGLCQVGAVNYFRLVKSNDWSDPKELDRKVAMDIKLMPQGFELGRGQIVQG